MSRLRLLPIESRTHLPKLSLSVPGVRVLVFECDSCYERVEVLEVCSVRESKRTASICSQAIVDVGVSPSFVPVDVLKNSGRFKHLYDANSVGKCGDVLPCTCVRAYS